MKTKFLGSILSAITFFTLGCGDTQDSNLNNDTNNPTMSQLGIESSGSADLTNDGPPYNIKFVVTAIISNCDTSPNSFDILVNDVNPYLNIGSGFVVPLSFLPGDPYSVEMIKTKYKVDESQNCQVPHNQFTCLVSKSLTIGDPGHKRVSGTFNQKDIRLRIECVNE